MAGSLSLKEEALAKIHQMLFRGELKQGELFSENDLVRILGMSRTPIREALSEVEREGLVHKIPQVGVRVVKFSDDDLREIYEARELLEARCAEILAYQVEKQQLTVLESLIFEMRQAAQDDDPERFLKHDLNFHWQIASFANRPLYRDWLQQIGNRVRIEGLVSTPRRDTMEIVVAEHTAILVALRNHDPQAARLSALQHIRETKTRINNHGGRPVF